MRRGGRGEFSHAGVRGTGWKERSGRGAGLGPAVVDRPPGRWRGNEGAGARWGQAVGPGGPSEELRFAKWLMVCFPCVQHLGGGVQGPHLGNCCIGT